MMQPAQHRTGDYRQLRRRGTSWLPDLLNPVSVRNARPQPAVRTSGIVMPNPVARRNVIRREWLDSFWPKREL